MKPKTVVCPTCWRANCKFFHRIEDLRFTNDERRRFFSLFHRTVCPVCKGLRCKKFGQCVKEKKLNLKKKCFPFWATNNP